MKILTTVTCQRLKKVSPDVLPIARLVFLVQRFSSFYQLHTDKALLNVCLYFHSTKFQSKTIERRYEHTI